jgi:hypothetical protein
VSFYSRPYRTAEQHAADILAMRLLAYGETEFGLGRVAAIPPTNTRTVERGESPMSPRPQPRGVSGAAPGGTSDVVTAGLGCAPAPFVSGQNHIPGCECGACLADYACDVPPDMGDEHEPWLHDPGDRVFDWGDE